MSLKKLGTVRPLPKTLECGKLLGVINDVDGIELPRVMNETNYPKKRGGYVYDSTPKIISNDRAKRHTPTKKDLIFPLTPIKKYRSERNLWKNVLFNVFSIYHFLKTKAATCLLYNIHVRTLSNMLEIFILE